MAVPEHGKPDISHKYALGTPVAPSTVLSLPNRSTISLSLQFILNELSKKAI
jgi:hypothetical protein